MTGFTFIVLFGSGPLVQGLVLPDERSRPSANFTMLPEALFEPSLARWPEIVSMSPILRLFLVMPRRSSMPGGDAEKPQLVTLPWSSFTSR